MPYLWSSSRPLGLLVSGCGRSLLVSGSLNICLLTGLLVNLECSTRKATKQPGQFSSHLSPLPRIQTISVVILRCLVAVIDCQLADSQNGFRVARGCRDNLFILHQVCQDLISNGQTAVCTYMYVDFPAAFDSVNHTYVCMALIEHGVSAKLVALIMAIYNQVRARVKGLGCCSRDFAVQHGVLQDDCQSPILFICVLDSVFKRSTLPTDGITLRGGLRVQDGGVCGCVWGLRGWGWVHGVCVCVCVSMGGCLMSSNVFILCSPSILAMLWNVTDRPRTFSMTGWGGGGRGKVPPCLPLLCYECVQATGDEWICSCCLWQPCMVTMR